MPAVCILVMIGLVSLDLIIKQFAVLFVQPVGGLSVIDDVLRLFYLENHGSGFGILNEYSWLNVPLTIILGAILIIILLTYNKHTVLSYAAIICMVSGGVGNMVDRLVLGYVVDYIHFYNLAFVFNLADILAGAGMLLAVIAVAQALLRRKNESFIPERA